MILPISRDLLLSSGLIKYPHVPLSLRPSRVTTCLFLGDLLFFFFGKEAILVKFDQILRKLVLLKIFVVENGVLEEELWEFLD